METERSMVIAGMVTRRASMCQRLPDDAPGVEDRSFEARAHKMWRRADLPSEDDAAVAAAEATAHDLFERDVARLAMAVGNRGHGAHHRRRAADVQLDGRPRAHGGERIVQRSGDESLRAEAAIFGRRDDRDPEVLEDVGVGEVARAAGAIEERR
jgi:hypothetical protein